MSPQRALLATLLLFQLLAYGGHQGLTIFYKLPDTGQPPVLLSLPDTVKLDIQDSNENLSAFTEQSNVHNTTKTLVRNESQVSNQTEPSTSSENEKSPKDVPETLVVQARPMHEVKRAEEANIATSTPSPQKIKEIENGTKADSTQPKEEQRHEDIPSFSEWAQKQLEEAEKQDTVLNHSSQPSHNLNGMNNKNMKLRSKNYASPACGAKVVAVNPEAGSASSILSPNKDEYMLNTCNSKIWFTVELCEAVQAQKIELANFELFSSSPKDFVVYFSDRFPARQWTSVGQFAAKNDKEVQSFDLYPHLFGKFIKVEMLSHYGSEHYCPISLFKVYGTSEFEVLEKENAQHPDVLTEDDDEILGDLPDVPISDVEVSNNLFGSARDAVMSIMKKAAQVLVKSEAPVNNTAQNNNNQTAENFRKCCSPSHIIVCDNCSDAMYNQIYDLISCSSNKLSNTINTSFVQETLKNTEICQSYGLDFRNKRTISFKNESAVYLSSMMSENYIAALCNLMAIIDKKVVLNTSYETELNVTSNLTLDKVSKTKVDDNNFNEIVQIPFTDKAKKGEEPTPKPETKVPIISDKPLAKEEDRQKEQQSIKLPEPQNKVAKEPFEVKESETKINEVSKKDNLKNNTTEDKTQTPEKVQNIPVNASAKVEVSESKTESINEIKVDPSGNATVSSDTPTDKIQSSTPDPLNSSDDIGDSLIIETESFLTELDSIISDPTIQTTTTQNVANNQGPPQKESVFLRLSNRVKTLERNMSLSAQYLEELSRRYKKQVEEMQKSFEKTILQINEERKKTEERDQHNLAQMSKLQQELSQLNEAMQILIDQQESWFGNITFFKFVLLQLLIIAVVFYYINKKPIAEQTTTAQSNRKSSKNRKNQDKRLRRKSVEGVSGHEAPSDKKRRPSEEAMHIARQSTENLQNDDDGEWQIAKKNRRRKTSIVHRQLEQEWIHPDSISVLKEIVIPLDEEEFIAPVSEPVKFIVPVIQNELPKTNGILNNLKAKQGKSRRLSSPAFFRSALSRQSSRNSPGATRANVPEALLPPGSPSTSIRSESIPVTSRENGGCSSDTSSIKQSKRRSFKSIFKKVF